MCGMSDLVFAEKVDGLESVNQELIRIVGGMEEGIRKFEMMKGLVNDDICKRCSGRGHVYDHRGGKCMGCGNERVVPNEDTILRKRKLGKMVEEMEEDYFIAYRNMFKTLRSNTEKVTQK